MGVTVQSAYMTLQTENDQAYKVVQEEYGKTLLNAAKRITDFDQKAVDDWYKNAEVNSSRILQLNADAGLDNEHMSSSTAEQLQTIDPYRRWQVISYNNIGGFNDHAYECLDCIGYLHYANKYNIVIMSMPKDSDANLTVLQDSKIKNDSNSKSDAIDLLNDIWGNLCVTGAHVAIRYVDLWIDGDFDERTTFQVGDQKTITVWAQNGVCGHDQDSMTEGVLTEALLAAQILS